jgi:hypothetical protein
MEMSFNELVAILANFTPRFKLKDYCHLDSLVSRDLLVLFSHFLFGHPESPSSGNHQVSEGSSLFFSPIFRLGLFYIGPILCLLD